MGAAAITGGLSAGVGLFNTISGAKEKRNAQKALEAYQRQQLQNEAENLRVSTLGADLQREEQAKLAATQVDALQGGGSRALIGGLGRIEAGNQNLNQQIAAGLDEQQVAIDREKMNEEIRLRGMQENRENADIEALSSQYQAGKQDMNMGIGNMIQGVGSVANQFGGAGARTAQTPTQVESLKPMGTNEAVQLSSLNAGLTPEQINLRLRPRRSGLGVFDVSNYNL
jgi:hypothetical protein